MKPYGATPCQVPPFTTRPPRVAHSKARDSRPQAASTPCFTFIAEEIQPGQVGKLVNIIAYVLLALAVYSSAWPLLIIEIFEMELLQNEKLTSFFRFLGNLSKSNRPDDKAGHCLASHFVSFLVSFTALSYEK